MANVTEFRLPFKAPEPQLCQHRVWCEHCDYRAHLDENVAGSKGDVHQGSLALQMRREHAKANPGHRARTAMTQKNIDTGADFYIEDFIEQAVRS